MTTRSRTDAHRPGFIVPADYDFVAFSCLKIEDLGDAMFLRDNREALDRHMTRTGGHYSQHAHGGNCHICGAHCIYTAVFHHKPTNVYIKCGLECTEKMDFDSGAGEAFRKQVKAAREQAAGKRKAAALLADAGLSAAWDIFVNYNNSDTEAHNATRDSATVCDIVGKLVQYGSISDKAMSFLRSLVERIANRPAIEAARAAEREAAKPVPAEMIGARVTVRGTVVGFRTNDFGTSMIVRHADGWACMGTVPTDIRDVQKGQAVQFDAVLKPSRNDPKFAYLSRPTKAKKL